MIATRLTAGVVLLAVLPCLEACAETEPGLVTDGRRFAVVDTTEQASADALISGLLDVDDHGCWVLRQSDHVSVMMWPPGTALSGKKIVLPGVSTPLGIGSAIQGGGGEGNPSKMEFEPCISKGDVITYISSLEMTPWAAGSGLQPGPVMTAGVAVLPLGVEPRLRRF